MASLLFSAGNGDRIALCEKRSFSSAAGKEIAASMDYDSSDMSQRIKTNYSYKGWNITLVMNLEGYMWTCQYIIRKSGRTVMDGFPGSTYLSSEEAEETALSTAKA